MKTDYAAPSTIARAGRLCAPRARRASRCARLRRVAVAAALLIATAASLPVVVPVAADAQGSFKLYGSGWGHGIGMSQYGALAQAQAGRSYGQILTHYYTGGSTVEEVVMPSYVRVGLAQGSQSIEFSGSGGGYGVYAGGNRYSADGGSWKIEATPGGLRVVEPSGASHDISGSSAVISDYEAGGVVVSVAQTGRRYGRGWLDVIRTGDSSLNLVLETNYDAYLYGLGEMPSSWPAAALQAQAVAGRTYALYKHNAYGDRRAGCDCTVYATTIDQNYVGWDKEAGAYGEEWKAAVFATSSVVVTYGGGPVFAFYHSSSGGRTETNGDVWGSSTLPYLQSVDDPWSLTADNPNAAWSAEFSEAQVASAFGLSSVSSIDLSQRTQGGGVAYAVIHGTSGGSPVAKTVRGDKFRSALGLKSTKIWNGPKTGFDEWLLLLNPADAAVGASISVERAGQAPAVSNVTLPGRSRSSFKINTMIGPGEASLRVTADAPIVAERAMYFNYRGWDGGATGEGVTVPKTTWFVAEGYEADEFDTYIEVYNPNAEPAEATITLMKEGGGSASLPVTVGPAGRFTLGASGVPGFEQGSFSTKVEASKPVVVDRSAYFRYVSPADGGVRTGGTASRGIGATRKVWDIAEGYSGAGFDTWILVVNPNAYPVDVVSTYFVEGGGAVAERFTMPPMSRKTTLAESLPGLSGRAHSTRVQASGPVAAERASYFDYKGYQDGHTAPSVPGPGRLWYLPEGYTGPGFDTWVLLSNPGASEASVRLTFYREGQPSTERVVYVAPRSRASINLRPLVGEVGVSTKVESINGVPVVAERATYFNYTSANGWSAGGGSDSVGAQSAARVWYFAEGYVQ